MLFSAENKCCARGFELLLLIFGQKIITPLRLAGQISQLQRGMEEYRPGVAGWCRVGDGEGGWGSGAGELRQLAGFNCGPLHLYRYCLLGFPMCYK